MNKCVPPCRHQSVRLQIDHVSQAKPDGKHWDTLAIHKLKMYEGAVATAPLINTRMRILCMRIEMPSNLNRRNVNRCQAVWAKCLKRCRRLGASDEDRCKNEMHTSGMALPSGGCQRHRIAKRRLPPPAFLCHASLHAAPPRQLHPSRLPNALESPQGRRAGCLTLRNFARKRGRQAKMGQYPEGGACATLNPKLRIC